VEETSKAKKAFKKYALGCDVRVQHYHADNVVFEANGRVEAIEQQGQGITFVAVDAHHQNGHVER